MGEWDWDALALEGDRISHAMDVYKSYHLAFCCSASDASSYWDSK